MFRASFCWWGHHAVTAPADEQALVRACASLELLHASALVHDDLMDASDTRRGNPATHRAFESEHRATGWRGDAGQYGAAGAILLGDLLLSWSEELLRRCGLPFDRGRARPRGLRPVPLGGDRRPVPRRVRAGPRPRRRRHRDDGAALQVGEVQHRAAAPGRRRPGRCLGGHDGGAQRLRAAARRGVPAPRRPARRLRRPGRTGKPAGDDLVEGKRTVLVALALDAAPPADAAELDAALGTDLTAYDVERLRRIIDDSGAHAQVEAVIEQLGGLALEALDRADIDDSAREVLRGLARAVTHRVVWRQAEPVTTIKINAITVPAGSGDELAHRFAARAGAVDDADGFEGFELLKPTDDREQWLVITRWRDEASFQAWVSSPGFAEGHRSAVERAGGEAPKPVSTHSEVWSYEVAGGSAPTHRLTRAQSKDGTSTSGPAPRRSTQNGGRAALRSRRTVSSASNASGSAWARGPQPSQSRTVGSARSVRQSQSASRLRP